MIIYGAGGHAKVVFDASQKEITYIVDDNVLITEFKNKPVSAYDPTLNLNEEVVIAVGDNATRKKIVAKMSHRFTTVEALSAIIDSTVEIGLGSMILHGAIVQADTKIGEHTIVNTGASIDHDCNIGDFCHIAPQVTLCGEVTVGDGTIIGSGATVVPAVTIGKWCKIGVGSVVTKNIPDFGVAVGNPARVIKIDEQR